MQNCHAVKTPATAALKTPTSMEETSTPTFPYRQLVGELMYLMLATRFDLAFAVGYLSRFVANYNRAHVIAAKRVLRYLRGTAHYTILFTRGQRLVIEGYSDTDWGGDLDTRKSTTGYIFIANNAPLSWRSKLQRVVALSSCEAELIGLNDATREALWLRKLMADLSLDVTAPMTIHEDNQGAIAISANQRGMSSRTKHVETRYFGVRQHVDNGSIIVVYCPTTEMIADFLTKPVTAVILRRLLALISVMTQNS